jgi:hypothetical protein
LQFYNYKKFDIITFPAFFPLPFYFVCLFRAALCRTLLFL